MKIEGVSTFLAVALFGTAVWLVAHNDAHADVKGPCITNSHWIFTRAGKSGYRGNVVYYRAAELERGERVLVLAELQAIHNTRFNIMFGSFLVWTLDIEAFKKSSNPSRERNEERSAPVGSVHAKEFAPNLTFNITPGAHYGVVSRHGVFTAQKPGKYYFGIAAYGASSGIPHDSWMGVQENACNVSVIRLN